MKQPQPKGMTVFNGHMTPTLAHENETEKR
jgi:hypothetical protein